MEAVIPFHTPSNCIVSGASSSGKTHLIFEILKCVDKMFNKRVKRIFFCYNVYQPIFDEMKKEIPHIEFFEGLPNRENMETWSTNLDLNILILDDLMEKAAKSTDIVDLFTQYTHHLNFFVFFLVQNLFAGGKYFRTLSLNAHYFILFRTLRDQQQISNLGRQIFGRQLPYFMDAFNKATQNRYSYLLIDISPHSDPIYKLRTHILPHQMTIVYTPVKK